MEEEFTSFTIWPGDRIHVILNDGSNFNLYSVSIFDFIQSKELILFV